MEKDGFGRVQVYPTSWMSGLGMSGIEKSWFGRVITSLLLKFPHLWSKINKLAILGTETLTWITNIAWRHSFLKLKPSNARFTERNVSWIEVLLTFIIVTWTEDYILLCLFLFKSFHNAKFENMTDSKSVKSVYQKMTQFYCSTQKTLPHIFAFILSKQSIIYRGKKQFLQLFSTQLITIWYDQEHSTSYLCFMKVIFCNRNVSDNFLYFFPLKIWSPTCPMQLRLGVK